MILNSDNFALGREISGILSDMIISGDYIFLLLDDGQNLVLDDGRNVLLTPI
jgi:hypothetical protein